MGIAEPTYMYFWKRHGNNAARPVLDFVEKWHKMQINQENNSYQNLSIWVNVSQNSTESRKNSVVMNLHSIEAIFIKSIYSVIC